MAIGNAVEKGAFVFVYDEKGHQLFTQPKGTAPGDGLKGYTGGTVNIQRGSFIFTYNDKGRQVSATPAR